MTIHSGTASPESWQDDTDSSHRPPTSTSDFSEHSFHSRSKSSAPTNSPKRLSMFSARSRSNTTNTSASTRQLPSASLNYDESPVQHDERASENVAKSLLVRGSRILRRQGSKLNVIATSEHDEEPAKGAATRFEVSNIFHRVPKLRRNESQDQMKRVISEPYNFHHVTHTSSSQFHALDNASNNNELSDEFSALQASQMPAPRLKGIRAQALQSDDDVSKEYAMDYAMREPTSPVSPLEMSPPTSPYEPKSPGRIENFSRPVSRLNKPLPPSPTMVAPPHFSSRQVHSDIPEPTTLAIDELLGVNTQPTIRDYEYPQLDGASFHKVSSLERIDLAAMFQTELAPTSPITANIYHEFIDEPSIEDDGKPANSFITNYLSDLEDVPEEDETKETAEPIEPIRRGSRMLSISGSVNDIFTDMTTSKSIVIVKDRHLSISEEIISPTIPQFQPIVQDSPLSQASDATRRTSAADLMNFPMTWDEDIDFCYEHEAVADCDFDWGRPSLDNSGNTDPATLVAPTTSTSKTLVPQYLQANPESAPATPDLDSGSAQSILTRSQDALTPLSDGAAHVDFFHTSTADKEYLCDVENEVTYENFLDADDDPDSQFQWYTQTTPQAMDITASPRSSFSQISKYNSQESVMLSRAASIVRKHRSSTSTTSVPELINSANSSRENTIRESIESIEHPQLGSLSDIPRQAYSIHRPVKSLGSEISTLSKLRSTGSNGSIHVVDPPYPMTSPTHDRTKSASATFDHHFEEAHKLQQSSQGLPFAARQSLGASKRKSRAGYSLFPVVQ